MWTLAHAHGTLLSVIHIGFAATVWLVPDCPPRSRKVASVALCLAGALIPLGFFLGGIGVNGGDPSLGILLLPAGAVLLFVAVLLTALHITDVKRLTQS